MEISRSLRRTPAWVESWKVLIGTLLSFEEQFEIQSPKIIPPLRVTLCFEARICALDLPSVSGTNARRITRRDLLVAAIAVGATSTVMVLAQTPAKPPMHSSVFNWDAMKVETTKTGERRGVFDAPTPTLARFECHITTLNPGEAPHAGHRHPEEELMIVKEGTLEAVQIDRTNRVEAGGMIFEASNEYHGVRNIGSNRATYYVLKWYPHDLARPEAK